jgi:hypothetical protein
VLLTQQEHLAASVAVEAAALVMADAVCWASVAQVVAPIPVHPLVAACPAFHTSSALTQVVAMLAPVVSVLLPSDYCQLLLAELDQ